MTRRSRPSSAWLVLGALGALTGVVAVAAATNVDVSPVKAAAPSSDDGLMFHWDASVRSSLRDTSGGTADLGDQVGSWLDLASGVTASAAQAGYRTLSGPTLTLVDGQPALQFPGNHGLTTAPVSLFATASSGLTVLAVMRPTEITQQRFLLMHATSNCTTNFELGVGTGAGGDGKWGLHRGCGHAVVTPVATLTSGSRAVVVTRMEPSGTDPNQVSFRVNGSVVASSTDGAGWLNPGSYPTAADRLRIGWRDDLGDGTRENSYFHGDVHEILIFDRAVSDSRLGEIEQHLVAKWQNGAFAPGSPTSVTSTATTTTSATVSWTAGPERGAPITAYHVTVSAGSTVAGTCSLTGTPPLTTCLVSGLSPSTTYSVSVSATNDFGTGAPGVGTITTATPTTPTPVVPPPPPTTTTPHTTTPDTVPLAPTTTVHHTTPPTAAPVSDAVPAGFARGALDGVPIPVEVVQSDVDLWSLIGSDYRFDLRLAQVDQPAHSGDGVVTLRTGTRALTSGEGFQPGSQVDIWIFSEPQLLGTLQVDAVGRFAGEIDVPDDLTEGSHTLQVNGLTTAGLRRSLSLGVRVASEVPQPVVAVLPSTGGMPQPWLLLATSLTVLGLLPLRRRSLR